MEIKTFSDLISTIGVPCACLAACFWLWYKESENHKAEMDKVTKALENNTLAIQKLIDKLEVK